MVFGICVDAGLFIFVFSEGHVVSVKDGDIEVPVSVKSVEVRVFSTVNVAPAGTNVIAMVGVDVNGICVAVLTTRLVDVVVIEGFCVGVLVKIGFLVNVLVGERVAEGRMDVGVRLGPSVGTV